MRAIASLKILTSISYGLLVLVPIIAACWPTIKTVLDYNDQIYRDNKVFLELSAERIDNSLRGITSENILSKNDFDDVSTTINDKSNELKKSIDEVILILDSFIDENDSVIYPKNNLPVQLGVAFFASLFVILGHLMYQIFAPSQIKEHTWEEYIEFQKNQFNANQTAGKINKARYFIDSKYLDRIVFSESKFFKNRLDYLNKLTEAERHEFYRVEPESQNLMLKKWVNISPVVLDKKYSGLLDEIETLNTLDSAGNILKSDQIAIGAKAEYIYLSGKSIICCLFSLTLYIFALGAILSLIIRNSNKVLEAIEIENFLMIFNPFI